MKIIGIIFLIFVRVVLFSQDISTFRKGSLFDKSASLSLGYQANTQDRDTQRVGSNTFFASLRGTLSMAGIQMPLNLTYRSGQLAGGFDNPFIRFGVSPSYKWVKLHLGHRQMHFSNYSFNGMTFRGVGLEVNPGILRLAGFKGYLQTPNYIQDSLAAYANLVQKFQRDAYGVKLGIGNNNNFLDIYFFKAKDKFDSVNKGEFFRTIFPPAENLVIGSKGSLNIFKALHIEYNLDLSTVTNNQLSRFDTIQDETSKKIIDIVDGFITTNNTTRSGLAYDGSINYKKRIFNIGVKYRQIDQNYKSFGMHYTLDDITQTTINTGLRLFKSKLNVNATYGVQRNNINQIKRNTSLRKVYNISTNIMISKTGGINATISNFALDQRPGLTAINDTFRLIQQTSVITISPYLRWGNTTLHHGIIASFNKNQVVDASPVIVSNREGSTQITSLSYTLDHKKSKSGFNLHLTQSNDKFNGIDLSRTGGSLGLRKTFEKSKLSLNVTGSYQKLRNELTDDGQVFSATLFVVLPVSNAGNLNLRTGFIDKSSVATRSFKEINIGCNFNYSFFTKKKKS
jgi:hypothetical protein